MANFNLTTATNLFKIKYGKLSDNVYNSANVLLGRVKKDYSFVGKRLDIAVPTSFSGGVGSGSLPTPNNAAYQDAQITAKKMYSLVQIDREAIKASETDEGAFVRMTKHVVQKGVESWMRNQSRAFFNDSTGSLGTFTATPTGSASAPVIVVDAASFKEANWEEKDYVNVDTVLSSVFEVISVVPATRTITLARISGSDDLTALGAGTYIVYMQNSKNNDPQGLKGVVDAADGSSLYGITVARRWKSFIKDASGAGLITDFMNETMLGVEKQSGKVPKMVVTSYVQFRKLLNLLEDQKTYFVEPRSPELKGKISFRGIEFMSTAGAIGVFAERFCDDDRMYFLNDDYITSYHRPGFGWFDDDGTVFLRESGSDAYGARYGGYLENYIIPSFQGVLKNLAT